MKMKPKRYSNLIGIDDAPFEPDHTGDVPVVGTVFTGLYMTGMVMGAVEKDGADAADRLAVLIGQSRFCEHIQLVMLQGITLAGFNVVDAYELSRQLDLPVLVVSRRLPDRDLIRHTLLNCIPGGGEKWALIEPLPAPEPVENVYIQRIGLSLAEAEAVIKRFAIHSHLPEPLRIAHLIARAVVWGESRGRP